MFSNHENTVLNQLRVQLQEAQEADKNELIVFIQSITKSTGNSSIQWNGERAMIDLCKVIKQYYYNPLTKGSNSIKKVLPAVFESSTFIRNKYTKPMGEIGINSLNFDTAKVWLNITENTVQDPYKTLPPLFEEWEDDFESM